MNYYSIFDYDNERIGLILANTDLRSLSMNEYLDYRFERQTLLKDYIRSNRTRAILEKDIDIINKEPPQSLPKSVKNVSKPLNVTYR